MSSPETMKMVLNTLSIVCEYVVLAFVYVVFLSSKASAKEYY